MDLLVNLGGVCLRDGESMGRIDKGTEGEGEFRHFCQVEDKAEQSLKAPSC